MPFNTNESLLSQTPNILSNFIQYDEDESIGLVVDFQLASLVPLLNPNAKEITKSESNMVQQIEMLCWDTVPENQIYAPGTGSFYKRSSAGQ